MKYAASNLCGRICAVLLCLSMILSLSACTKPSYNMTLTESHNECGFVLSDVDDSKSISLPQEAIRRLHSDLDAIQVVFPYSDLFETEECFRRLQTTVSVSKHDCVFNSLEDLTPGLLFHNIKQNNAKYMKTHSFEHKQLKDDFLLEISKLIVDTLSKLKEQYPEIDYARVLCNLSNLKILYKRNIASSVQVTADMVMNIGRYLFELMDSKSGENSCRNAIICVIMYIVQSGCKCEGIEHCTRRFGFSYLWDDFEINTTYFDWLISGSAKRMVCNITGDVAQSYDDMVNYICTANLATVLNDAVPVDYLETLSFYSDVDKAYELFGCDTKEGKIELLNMLIAADIILGYGDFWDAYQSVYKKGFSDTAFNEVRHALNPSVCMVLTRVFYKQLLDVISSNPQITANDLMFVINLFEVCLDSHLWYSRAEDRSYSEDFIKTYLSIRDRFFEEVSGHNDIDISTQYESYSILTDGNTIRASLKWLSKDKKDFLLEQFECLGFNRNSKIQ